MGPGQNLGSGAGLVAGMMPSLMVPSLPVLHPWVRQVLAEPVGLPFLRADWIEAGLALVVEVCRQHPVTAVLLAVTGLLVVGSVVGALLREIWQHARTHAAVAVARYVVTGVTPPDATWTQPLGWRPDQTFSTPPAEATTFGIVVAAITPERPGTVMTLAGENAGMLPARLALSAVAAGITLLPETDVRVIGADPATGMLIVIPAASR